MSEKTERRYSTRQGNLSATCVMWIDETSLHSKCKYMKTKRQRFLYSYPIIEMRTGIMGQLRSPNFKDIIIHYGQNQDTLCIYGEHLCQGVMDKATRKKTLHKYKH